MANRSSVPQPRTDRERVDWIIEGLIADKHYEIYQKDAEFHTAIEVMARGLLPFMDVLADQAWERQAEMHRMALLIEGRL